MRKTTNFINKRPFPVAMGKKDIGGLVSLVSVSDNPCIEELATTYRVHPVSYLGNVCYVDIEKELENGGREATQQAWVALSEKVPSGPLYVATMDTLHQNKDHPVQSQRALVETVRTILAKDFKHDIMITSTHVRYGSNGVDTVVHDCGYASERAEEAKIIGLDGYINEASGFGEAMGALVGISDCHKINEICRWVTGRKAFLWRFNKSPQEDVEKALVLGGYDNLARFDVYVGRHIGNVSRARGMVAHVAENSP